MRKGFTIVELSIVLVILGLITGGIIAGQSLIRASQLRALSTEMTKTQTAFQAFRDKYRQLPGDINNATNYWGTATVCPGDYTTPATDSKTCNGNNTGNFTVEERYRAWQHLANAGLIEGKYTGVPASAGAGLSNNGDVPLSKLSNAMYQVMNSDDGNAFPARTQAALIFLSQRSISISAAQGIVKPEEAWNIDTKMDDGKPGTGVVTHFTSTSSVGACVSSSDAATATYVITSSALVCAPIYLMGM